ncbi:MAG TPA: hypothetical protein VKV80_08100 [Streptosporangiaceae bacterium]|jgi:uncharacterized membrane-anchored protein|nr:hypothetical protein [Streptosporangiaceae bacterium]
MYGWLWRMLPGRSASKAALMTLILAAAAAALWIFVFPWAQAHIPIDGSSIGG